jgi:hypothetical protein
MAKYKMPSINGFTIGGLKSAKDEFGCIVKCSILFEGKKVAEYIDSSEKFSCQLNPAPGFSRDKIIRVVRSFPARAFISDYDPDYSFTAPWYLDSLVEELLYKQGLMQLLVKSKAKGNDLVVVECCWDYPRGLVCEVPSQVSDEQLKLELDGIMKERGVNKYEFRRCRQIDDLSDRNAEVTIDMLR